MMMVNLPCMLSRRAAASRCLISSKSCSISYQQSYYNRLAAILPLSSVTVVRSFSASSSSSTTVVVTLQTNTSSTVSSNSSSDKHTTDETTAVLTSACGTIPAETSDDNHTPDDEEEEDDMEEMFVEPDESFAYRTKEWGGPRRGGKFLEPTRFGDWERKGRCSDF